MKTARTIFLVARTHGLKAHLLGKKDFTRLLAARDLTEMRDMLFTSDYSTELSRIPEEEVTAFQLERIFYEKLSERLYSLLSVASGNVGRLLETYAAMLEIENLKRIIRAVHGKRSIVQGQLIRIPRRYQRANFRALSAAKTTTEIVNLLRESPYADLKNQLENYERSNNPVLLEAELDKIYYNSLQAHSNKIPNRKNVSFLIGMEVDIRNLQLVIESKYMELDSTLVRRLIIDFRSKMSRSKILRLINADIEEIPQLVQWPSYAELCRKAVELVREDRIVDMEGLFSQYIFSYSEEVGIMNPNSLVFVFSYMKLCLREARNLSILTLGKQLKMNNEKLGNLIFH